MVRGEKNTIRVKLRNQGPRQIDGLVVKLSLNGIQAATASATLEPNSNTEIAFDVSSGLQGLNSCVISFNDFPAAFDNEFFFTLNFSRTIRVMEIKPDREPTYVEKVFGNRQLFQFRSFQSSNVDYSQITSSDLVVIMGVNNLDAALGAALASFRNAGGTILMIPGTQPNVNSYSAALGLPPLRWLPGDAREELDKPDYSNPLFENIFEERSTQLAMPTAKRRLDWGQDRTAVLRFRDGSPYLSQFGKLFLLASPLSKDDTDFYNHALFVPVMYRLAASGMKNESRLYYFLADNIVTVLADSLYGEEPVRLAGQQEIIPPQRKDIDKVVMELPKFSMNSGFYEVMFQRDTLDRIAFNLSREESFLECFSTEDLEQRLGNRYVSVFLSKSPSSFAADIKDRYLGTPLWKHALVLALLFLLAEVLLIRFLK